MGLIPGRGNRNPFQHSCLKIPSKEEPGGLGHRVTNGWTQLSTQFVWQPWHFSKRRSHQSNAMPRILSRFLQLLHLYPFSTQDAKWHFAIWLCTYLHMSQVFGFPWFFMTFKRGSQVFCRKSPSCLTPQRWSVLLEGRIPHDSQLGCELWPPG